MILDKEIIEDVNIFNFGASDAIRENVNWLVKNVNLLVTRKRLQLLDKKPGAVYGGDPKIIFTTMLKRATMYHRGSKMESVCSLRSKFNKILSCAAAKYDNYLLQIKSCISPDHFDSVGNLSSKGKSNFWYEMDELIQKVDTNKVKLIPQLHADNFTLRGKGSSPKSRYQSPKQKKHRRRSPPKSRRNRDHHFY